MRHDENSYDRFLPVGEVAKLMSCAVPTVYRWVAAGEFPKQLKFGGSARWSLKEIKSFIEKKKIDGGPDSDPPADDPPPPRRLRRPKKKKGR